MPSQDSRDVIAGFLRKYTYPGFEQQTERAIAQITGGTIMDEQQQPWSSDDRNLAIRLAAGARGTATAAQVETLYQAGLWTLEQTLEYVLRVTPRTDAAWYRARLEGLETYQLTDTQRQRIVEGASHF